MERGEYSQIHFTNVFSPVNTAKLERIKEALSESGVFCGGDISFPRFKPWEGLLEIRGERNAKNGPLSASITFSKGDCTLNNNGLMPDPLCWGIWNPVQMALQIISEHYPVLAKKILPKEPQAGIHGRQGVLLKLRP